MNLAGKKDNETQIAMLNTFVRLRIAPSKIHGVGIFAVCDIPAETKLYTDNMPEIFNLPYQEFSKLFPHVRKLLLERWPQIVNGSAFLYPDARMLAYCNHNDEANYDAINDRTLRDIKEGEEVTEDYRKIPGFEKVFVWLADKDVV